MTILGIFEMFQNPSFLAVKNETAKRSNLAILFFILLDLSENLLFKIMAIRINLLIVGKAWLWPQNIIFENLHSKKWDFKWANPDLFLFIFVLFKHNLSRKNCSHSVGFERRSPEKKTSTLTP